MKTKEFKPEKASLLKFKINSELNKYDDVILFPEKLAKANETIRRLGIPKEFRR